MNIKSSNFSCRSSKKHWNLKLNDERAMIEEITLIDVRDIRALEEGTIENSCIFKRNVRILTWSSSYFKNNKIKI